MRDVLFELIEEARKVLVSEDPPSDAVPPVREGEVPIGTLSLRMQQLVTILYSRKDVFEELEESYDPERDQDGSRWARIYALEAEIFLLTSMINESLRCNFAQYVAGGGSLLLREGWAITWGPSLESDSEDSDDEEDETGVPRPRTDLSS